MNRPVHFEIHADDMDRCEHFYTTLFGWKFTKRDGGDAEYRIIVTGEEGTPGINGGMVKRSHGIPAPQDAVKGYVCTIEVANIDAMVESALANGAVVALPKMPIPGMGRLAYLIDTEKNIFGVMQSDPTAK